MMLYAIKGDLIKKESLKAIVDVNGIIFDVSVPLSTLEKLPESGQITLFVELVIGEKSIKLYGFSTEEEKLLFNRLRKISKIGAQTAISILSNIAVQDFYRAIEQQNKDLLMSIPGIGKKTALSIIVEMASKLPKPEDNLPSIVVDTVETLKNLGFSTKEAGEIVSEIHRLHPEMTLEELLKESLKRLKKNVY